MCQKNVYHQESLPSLVPGTIPKSSVPKSRVKQILVHVPVPDFRILSRGPEFPALLHDSEISGLL